MKYISDGTWFDQGSECFLASAPFFDTPPLSQNSADFVGPKQDHVLGPTTEDNEICSFDEFDIWDDDENFLLREATSAKEEKDNG